jgi:hypothetical protein
VGVIYELRSPTILPAADPNGSSCLPGAGGRNDNYGSARAAQPGRSQGRPTTNTGSQPTEQDRPTHPVHSRRPCPGRSHRNPATPVTPQGASGQRDRRRRHLHTGYQRDREPERSLPPGGACPRPLPQRTVGDEDPLPGHPIPRPQRHRPDTMGRTVETSPQRLRRHLRRSHAGRRRKLIMETATYTVRRTVPAVTRVSVGGPLECLCEELDGAGECGPRVVLPLRGEWFERGRQWVALV